MRKARSLVALSFGLALSFSPASAQAGGGAAGGGGTARAALPQYWIADSHIFIGNGAHTAAVMGTEQSLSTQAPQLLGSQAQALASFAERALSDMQQLNVNAEKTNPDAVPAIRVTMAQLQAALNQAQTVANASKSGNLGPTYRVTLTSALQHLQAADAALRRVAALYPNAQQYMAGFNVQKIPATGTATSGFSAGAQGGFPANIP